MGCKDRKGAARGLYGLQGAALRTSNGDKGAQETARNLRGVARAVLAQA